MILPIISSLSRDLFLTVPGELTDGAAALGATRWEIIRGVVLPTTVSGVAAASVLGLGRALGEAIAVTLLIGDGTAIHGSLFAPARQLASRIAYSTRTREQIRRPLALLPGADPARDDVVDEHVAQSDRRPVRRPASAGPMSAISTRPGEVPLFDPTSPLTASGNLRRRAARRARASDIAVGAALFAVAMLGIVVVR